MKVLSSKNGSIRERVDAEADLLPVANWRIEWTKERENSAMVKASARHLVLPSKFGAERSTELWLTEAEAVAVARAVTNDFFDKATERSG